MTDHGVGSWVERRARISPDHPAIIAGETTYSYAELAGRIRRLAHGLRRLGVQRGDRVGWLGPNHPAFLEALFATAKLGAVFAPVNHRLDPETIGRVFAETGPRCVVAVGPLVDLPLPPTVESRVVVGAPRDGAAAYEHLIVESPDDPIDESIGLDDLCTLPHSSGTTGTPKGVT